MPLVWRNRGLLLLNHAIRLQQQHKGGSTSAILIEFLCATLITDSSITEDVIQSCKDLITSHFFAVDGLPTVTALHLDDHEGHLILRCATIVAHTAMSILLRTLSQALSAGSGNSPLPTEDQDPPAVYRRRCRKSLKEAIKITRGLAHSDFPFIDVVMAVSFPLSAFTLYVAESIRLRYVGSRS